MVCDGIRFPFCTIIECQSRTMNSINGLMRMRILLMGILIASKKERTAD
jgi:hypothetical protein